MRSTAVHADPAPATQSTAWGAGAAAPGSGAPAASEGARISTVSRRIELQPIARSPQSGGQGGRSSPDGGPTRDATGNGGAGAGQAAESRRGPPPDAAAATATVPAVPLLGGAAKSKRATNQLVRQATSSRRNLLRDSSGRSWDKRAEAEAAPIGRWASGSASSRGSARGGAHEASGTPVHDFKANAGAPASPHSGGVPHGGATGGSLTPDGSYASPRPNRSFLGKVSSSLRLRTVSRALTEQTVQAWTCADHALHFCCRGGRSKQDMQRQREAEAESLSEFHKVRQAVLYSNTVGRRHTTTANVPLLSFQEMTRLDAAQERGAGAARGWDRLVSLPGTRWRSSWDLFVIALVVWNAFALPLDAAFSAASGNTVWAVADVCIDVVFIADIVLNFRTAYQDNARGVLVTDGFLMAKHYVQHWFLIDLMSVLPFELLLAGASEVAGSTALQQYSKLLKCFRLFRLGRVFKYLEALPYASFVRLTRLMVFFLSCIHWIGCAWHWLALLEGDEPSIWIDVWEIREAPLLRQYVASVYAGMCMLVGENLDPQTTTERVFALVTMCFGAGMTASLFGQVALVLQTVNAEVTQFRERMQSTNNSMHRLNLPHSIQKRVRNYMEYKMNRHHGAHRQSFLAELSESLEAEVLLYLNQKVVQAVPLFKDCNADFLIALVKELDTKVFLPGDFIVSIRARSDSATPCADRRAVQRRRLRATFVDQVRFGEYGHEMYFIVSGEIEVLSQAGEVIHRLYKQSYFGDLALLRRVRRTASCRAATYCDTNVLNRASLNKLLDDYPEMHEKMVKSADDRIRKYTMSLPGALRARVVAKRMLARARSRRGRLDSKGSPRSIASPRDVPQMKDDGDNFVARAKRRSKLELEAIRKAQQEAARGAAYEPPSPRRSVVVAHGDRVSIAASVVDNTPRFGVDDEEDADLDDTIAAAQSLLGAEDADGGASVGAAVLTTVVEKLEGVDARVALLEEKLDTIIAAVQRPRSS